ncbi:MAG: aminotransferase class I/II-fold pyridoxal phosphate-dependent enzyme [Bdellovibrionia bacterium]
MNAPDQINLEPSSEELASWFKYTELLSQDFIRELKTALAYRPLDAQEEGNNLFATETMGFHAALSETLQRITQFGIDTSGGRYFGYIPGGGVPLAAFGDFIAALTNRYAGMFMAAPGAVRIENEVLQTFLDLFKFPTTAWGTLTSGGSIANLTAVLAARQTRHRREWEHSTIYLTEQSHNSIQRALKVAGLNPELFRQVPVDSNFRMDTVKLRELIQKDTAQGFKPWMILCALGTTNTGSVDPIEELVKIKNEFQLWLHVDAAYGGFFRLARGTENLFQGVGDADSIVLDPHKSLFMPYGCGAVLIRNGEHLREAFAGEAVYLADIANTSDKSPADYSPELTRHFRGLRIYLCLKTYGVGPFKAALEEKLELTQWAYKELMKIQQFEFACAPELSLIVFRMRGEDAITQELLKQILKRGRVHMSSTRLNGQVYLRICILSFRSRLAEVQECVAEIRQALTEVSKFLNIDKH